MRHPAQIQAAIDILKEMAVNPRPADRVIAYYFKQNRYIGSKDKKVIAEAVYGVLRHQGFIDWALAGVQVPPKPRSRVAAWLLLRQKEKDLRTIFDGEKYSPQKLWRTEKPLIELKKYVSQHKKDMPFQARFNLPTWLEPMLQQACGEDLPQLAEAMAQQAPADVRTNTLKTNKADLAKKLANTGSAFSEAPFVPTALRLEERKNLFELTEFKEGLFEVQDAGSQVVAALCHARPGHKVTDFCAGAGGKTLALAAQMQNKGMLTAADIIPPKLAELKKRLKRAGVDNTTLKELSDGADSWVKRHKGTQDVVLLDVPCSGSGVWRRNPDAKWDLTPEGLEELCAIQKNILQSASRLVKVGGRLVYATCSLLPAENQQQIKDFMAGENRFTLVPVAEAWAACVQDGRLEGGCPEKARLADGTLQLRPDTTNTDGFFVTILERHA